MTASEKRFTAGAAWLHRIVADLPELTDWAWSLDRRASESLVMRVLRGRHMQTLPTLCDEMGAALQFPYYFGANFNAIEIVGDRVGPVVLSGQGAGPLPTSSAILSDIVEAARAGTAAIPSFPEV